jgi:succinate dehydrogenase flavin-adding protein (antitoxin of CptAB toxin-antitoxin module)
MKFIFKSNLGKYNYTKFNVTRFPCKFLCQSEQLLEAPKFKTNLKDDLEIAKKQVFWRIRNIGQLELEHVIMKWYAEQNLNLSELKQFSEEVLEMENPEMNMYFVQFEPAPENLNYTQKIQNFILK